jgi:hypothetical protein
MSLRDDGHRRRIASDRIDRDPIAERRRRDWALSRADRHSVRELYFLELAVKAPDEDSANALELYAYEAYKDALAIKEEHGLDR